MRRPPRSRSSSLTLEAPYREALKASKMTMLSAEERAVLGTPADEAHAGAEKAGEGARDLDCGSPGRKSRRPSRPTRPTWPGASG